MDLIGVLQVTMNRRRIALLALTLLAPAMLPTFVSAAVQATAAQLRSDSRAPYVHRITLYDHAGEAIDPRDEPAMPYSPRATCGKCHPYAAIRHGWHFNADLAGADAASEAEPGRPGEPWILSDPATGTQIPISSRGWPGTFTPAQVGLTNWQFALRFGRHMPGGGLGDPSQEVIDNAPEARRWGISGNLEIDCMVCHSADARHDPAEAARQIEKQNFKWAPTAALGLAVIRGAAKKMPDDWDPFMPPDPDFPERSPPTVVYDPSRFDGDDRVFFNTTLRPSPDRCYFCHSFREAGREAWHSDGDVHLTSGMICTDCHRTGIDHRITRGFVNDPRHAADPAVADTLTCRGCHLGTSRLSDGPDGKSGRLGAPYPEHKGMPLVHFERLTCTACHAGPWPQDSAKRFQTAMSHGLGLPSRERSDDDPPTILGPIFARGRDGRIAPHRMIWPAYWGAEKEGRIEPLPLARVQGASAKLAGRAKPKHPPDAGPLTDDDIMLRLTQLAPGAEKGESIVYIRDGRAVRLAPDGKLTSSPHNAGRPVLWAVAHDVRPASQALGIRGCTDCHASDAPLMAGSLSAAGEHGAERRPLQKMHEIRGDDATLAAAWSLAFRARSAFKWFGILCAGILGIVLLRHGWAGAGEIVRRAGRSPSPKR